MEKMLTSVYGCGHNGFSQLDGFKSLSFDGIRLAVSNMDYSQIRTEKQNKVMLPELLVRFTDEYDMSRLMFTWSRVAATFKRGVYGCTTFITGFTNMSKNDTANNCAKPTVLNGNIAEASTDTDILFCESDDVIPNKILFEKSTEPQPVSICLPSETTTVQMVCGGHKDFFSVYDSMTFGKLCISDGSAENEKDPKESEGKVVLYYKFCPVDSGVQIKEASCGKEHILLLSQSGTVYTYGLGSRGQLGHGTVEPESSLRLLTALEGVRMKSIVAGGWHSAAVSEYGDLYMWGWNESGQLGIPSLSRDRNLSSSTEVTECVGIQSEPSCVTLPDELSVSAVACGSRHTIFLTEDSRVFACGWNAYGQLGLGDTKNQDQFTEVVAVRSMCVRIYAGQWNSFFICVANKPEHS